MENNKDKYEEYLMSTIFESYPKYSQQNMLKELDKLKIVNLKNIKPENKKEGSIDLFHIEGEYDKLTTSLQKEKRVINYFERNEFHKSYKYSAVFTVGDIDLETLKELCTSGKASNFFDDETHEHDILCIDHNNVIPTYYHIGNVHMLKFSMLLTGYVPATGQKKEIKYPVIAVYFKHLNVLEIRMDRVKMYFQEDDFFYHNHIQTVLNWFENNLFAEIENINFSAIIEYIKQQDQNDVSVHAQEMSLASGGKAVLETGINENYILPLLGELKQLIKSNEELFSQSPQIKQLLDTFISETEETADLPWISLSWKGKDRKSGTIVKFKHNYLNQDYTFLQYYGLQSNMEKMDNVTQYIIDYKRKYEKSIESSEDGEIPSSI